MLKIKSYVKVNSIEEAYELNQKKTAIVLGGMVWLKMGNRNISTAIDLSGLGLAGIQETDEEFVIGCMTTLRELETDKRLNEYTQGAVRESVRHIVGVQFRNCATVGGSIWGRYGFSDVLTMFLGMDTWVELHDAGKIPLTEFVDRKKDNDILVNIIVKEAASPRLLYEPEKYKDRLSGTDLLCFSDRKRSEDSDRCKACPCHGRRGSGSTSLRNFDQKMSKKQRKK